MNFISIVVDIILAAYIVRECISFVTRYRRLKEEVASGDPQARTRLYRETIIFEWVSAGLAVIALRFDWRTLNPNSLGLHGSRLPQALTLSFNRDMLLGMILPFAIGMIAMVVWAIWRKRRGGIAVPSASASRWHRLMPDFAALAPVTKHERLLWVLVALSAGICEEIVFRGWLLFSLHSVAGLQGTLLLATAAALFGLGHAYQKITGVILTAFLGLVFCVIYVKTGSLVVPIVLHCLVDLKFAILPAPRPERTAPAYA